MVSINLSLRANNQLIHQLCSLECHSWFRKSESSLPKPLKPPSIGNLSFSLANGNLRLETARSDLVTAREDRRSYKNISIYVTELPPTPTLWVPRNSPPSTHQQGEETSPPLPQTPERPNARTPSSKPTPRKSNQGYDHFLPLTYQNQTRPTMSAMAATPARAVHKLQTRPTMSDMVVTPARAVHELQTRPSMSAMAATPARAVHEPQTRNNASISGMAARVTYQNHIIQWERPLLPLPRPAAPGFPRQNGSITPIVKGDVINASRPDGGSIT